MADAYPYVKACPILLPLAWTQRIVRYALKKPDTAASLTLAKERLELLKRYEIIE